MYNFDEIIDRKGTNSVTYEEPWIMYPELPKDTIPMWVADMDFACPQPILDAMKARLDRRILGYNIITDPAYFEAVISWMKRRHDWDVTKEQIVHSSGVVRAMLMAVDKLTKPGDKVLLNTPAYSHFENEPRKCGRETVHSPLINTDGYYTVDFEDFEAKAKDPDVTLFFLCNPHNPTGRVWTEEELRRMGEICFANNVFVVSDEIHEDIVRMGQKHIPFAKLFPNEKRLITCTAPSKTFNLAGNQLGNLIIPDLELAAEWRNNNVCGAPGALAIDACRAAYDECEDWVDEMKAYLDGNFAYLKERVEKELPKAKMQISEGTYLAWVDLRGYSKDNEVLRKAAFEKGLFIQFGDEFVANGDGFARINLACPRSKVEKGMDRLVAAMTEL